MRFLRIALQIIQAIYLFLLYVIRVVYSFFQIYKSKVKPYNFKIQRHRLKTARARPYLRNTRSVRIRRKSRIPGAFIFKAVLNGLTHRSARFYKISAGGFGVGLIVVCVVFFSGLFSVNQISVVGISENNKQLVQGYIDSAKKNKELSQNTLFFSLTDIKRKVLQQHPTVADIQVTKSLPNSVEVQIIDRIRAGIWCADTTPEPQFVPVVATEQSTQTDEEQDAETQAQEVETEAEQASEPVPPVASIIEPDLEPLQCFYYGSDGVIFQESPNTSQGFLIREVRDKRYTSVNPRTQTTTQSSEQSKNSKTVYLGSQVLTEQDIAQLDLLYAALTMGVEFPTYITLVDEYEMRAGFQQGWEVYFSRQDPLVQQVENLAAVLNEHIEHNKRFLEYIDVRYGNKIFYKYIAL